MKYTTVQVTEQPSTVVNKEKKHIKLEMSLFNS